uniref:Uncharacterized protein n=1 Tax=Caenorhabditis japonica TaxID=281687 RepID=A0A8R1E4G5_CAEJA
MAQPSHLSQDTVIDKSAGPNKAEVAAPVSGKSRRNPVANTEESTSEKKSRVTSNEAPARVVAATSQSCGTAPAGPQEDIIVASQSNVAPERNAQHPSINVITQSDCQQAAAETANNRGTTRSSSLNRRVTRAMSASQQPRVNVFAMKCAATIQISPEPTRKIFTYLCATSRTTSLQGPRQAHQRVGRHKVRRPAALNVATTKNVLNGPSEATVDDRSDQFHQKLSNPRKSTTQSHAIDAEYGENHVCLPAFQQPTATFVEFQIIFAVVAHVTTVPKEETERSGATDDRQTRRSGTFSPGRHTDVAHEDELVLAADGPEKPLRDTPASSLATAAVASASFETTSTASIPVSIPVNNSGHPSPVSSSLLMSTYDAKTTVQRPKSQWKDDYDVEIEVTDQKIHVSPPAQQGEKETSRTPEFEFAVPAIIREAQVPQADTPPLAPVETDPEQVVTTPVTQFATFVHHAHRGFSAVLPPVNQAITADNRPVLRFVYFFRDLHRKAQKTRLTDISSDPRKELGHLPLVHIRLPGHHRRPAELRQHRRHTIIWKVPQSENSHPQVNQLHCHTAPIQMQLSLMLLGEKFFLQKPSDVGQSMQPGRGRQPFPEPRKQSECEVRRFHSNVTLFESQEDPRSLQQQVDLPPAQLPPIAPSATPMRTSSNIVVSPSQNGPKSQAAPSSSSRQPPPPPLVTGTALNHDYTPYVLRKTRRKPVRYRD